MLKRLFEIVLWILAAVWFLPWGIISTVSLATLFERWESYDTAQRVVHVLATMTSFPALLVYFFGGLIVSYIVAGNANWGHSPKGVITAISGFIVANAVFMAILLSITHG